MPARPGRAGRRIAGGGVVAQDSRVHHSDAGPDTFPALVLHHARVRGMRPALREKDLGIWQTLTWAQLARQMTDLAGGLAALGIQAGEHVAIVGEIGRASCRERVCDYV